MLETLCFEKIGGKEEYCVTGLGNVSDVDIVIPSTYNGLPVTSIDDSAFLYCESLTSVVIPNSVKNIGARAFYNCSGLTSVEIPNSVTSIGVEAFSGCGNLTIYCEAEREPNGWNSNWNIYNRPVVWGYKGK